MESTLVEMRKINTLISGVARADKGKGKEKEAPGLSAAYRTPEPRRQAEQEAAPARNPEESEAAEEGGRLSKRPHTTGEGSTLKSTPDPIAKRTRARTSNPEGSEAFSAMGEKSSQPPQGGSYNEGEEYNLRKTPGGSAFAPLGVSE